jgi:hypothetical protein
VQPDSLFITVLYTQDMLESKFVTNEISCKVVRRESQPENLNRLAFQSKKAGLTLLISIKLTTRYYNLPIFI